jgi:hypothetical protein
VQALRYERYDLINAYVVDTAGEEQNRLKILKPFIHSIKFHLFNSLNGSSENYANVVVPSDSTSSDPTKSSIPEVNLHNLFNKKLRVIFQ